MLARAEAPPPAALASRSFRPCDSCGGMYRVRLPASEKLYSLFTFEFWRTADFCIMDMDTSLQPGISPGVQVMLGGRGDVAAAVQILRRRLELSSSSKLSLLSRADLPALQFQCLLPSVDSDLSGACVMAFKY